VGTSIITGNVGIGTALPSDRLHLATSTTGANIGTVVQNGNQQYRIGIRGDTNNSLVIQDDTATAFRMVINTAGNVGFGTSLPIYSVDVVGSLRATSGDVTLGSLLTSTANVTTGTIGTLVSSNINSTITTIGTLISSNVNSTISTIGTLISSNVNATTYTGGSMSLSGNLTLAGTLTTVNITTTNISQTNVSAGSVTATNNNVTTQTVGISRITTSLLALGNSNTVGNLFTTGGNVGINTVSPSVRLHVNGEIGFPYGSSIRVSPESSGSWPSGTTKLIESGWSLNGMASDVVSIYTPGSASSTDRINISSNGTINLNGNVGIGTKSPSFTLDVSGSARMGGNGFFRFTSDADPYAHFGGSTLSGDARLNVQDRTGNFISYYVSTTKIASMSVLNNNALYLNMGSNGGNQQIALADIGSTGFWGLGAANSAMQYMVGSGASGAHVFYTNSTTGQSNAALGTERLRIMANGRVGVGISSPICAVDIHNAVNGSNAPFLRLGNSSGGSGNQVGIILAPWSGRGGGSSSQIVAIDDGNASSHLTFWTAAAGGDTTSVERVRITNSGNLGIGTITPSSRLHIIGGMLVGGNNSITTEGAHIQWNRSGGDGETWIINQRGSGTSNAGIRFGGSDTSNNTTEWMRINNSGFVGIGTTDPRYPLHVGGETTNSDVTSFLFYINGPGVGGSITYTGGFSARFVSRIIAGEYWGTSDVRAKTDIQPIDDNTSLSILRNLEPKTFTFIDKLKNPNKVYGFIAQDLEPVLPDAVVDSKDFIPNVYCSGTVTATTGSSIVTLSKPFTNVFTYNNIEDDLRVRIICEKEEHIVKVVSVLDSSRFVVDKEIQDTTVFVYGQEVTDFKTVNKDVIAAVTTAAVQEIDRQLQKEREKTANLELQLSNLLEKYEQVLTRLSNLESNN